MKYAILSDIHGNLEALEETLKVCREKGAEKYICLGDIVGYNANPAECLEICRALPGFVCVKGNHDEYAALDDDTMEGFNPHAKAAVRWTKSVLAPEMSEYLRQLPFQAKIPEIPVTVVHASLDNPQVWGYIFDVHQAQDHFSYQNTPISFCGHSHVPVAFLRKPVTLNREIAEIPEWADRRDEYPQEELNRADSIELSLKTGYWYLINVGSVGQPRNHDTRASFAIYDTDKKTVTRYRIPYDIASAQAKVREAGLPERLWTRLARGT